MARHLLSRLVGSWAGTCCTWFQPDQLADESPVTGEILPLLDGQFVRHQYASTIQGQPRRGEELITFNSVAKLFQIAWIDGFHMNYAIMFSAGPATETGFSVSGQYDVSADDPPWGWKTIYHLVDDDHLLITAYNVSPDGDEAKAVETTYLRSKAAT